MARPVVPALAEELHSRLGPWMRADGEDTGWSLLHLCDALTQGLQPIEDVIRDTDDGPGWSIVMDPDRAPVEWLPWLAQFVGVRIPPGLDEYQARERVRGTAGFNRGTVLALRTAVAETLTGSKTVRVVERVGGNAYQIQIVTSPSETPDLDATYAAIVSQKPAGLVYTHLTADSYTIGEIETLYTTIGDLEATYATIGDFEGDGP